MSTGLTAIYTQTLSSNSASVTFNNIPQSYNDLMIIATTGRDQSVGTGSAVLRFNGDTSTSYSSTRFGGIGSSGTYTQRQTSTDTVWYGEAGEVAGLGEAHAASTIFIPNYTSGMTKTFSTESFRERDNAATYMAHVGGQWRKNEPITSVTLYPQQPSVLWLAGTSFTLYGLMSSADTDLPAAPTIGTIVDEAGILSVPFTPASNDRSKTYAVTTSPSSTTAYGATSPIRIPVSLNTSYTAQVSAVNSLGSSASSSSNAITTINNYTSIATQAIGSNTSTITFSNIPQNYKNLQLRIFARGSNAATSGYSYINFNEDAGANYSTHYLTGTGATTVVASYVNSAQPLSLNFPCANANANVFGSAIVDILDYRNTSKFKTGRIFNGWDNNGSGNVFIWSMVWNSIAPITSIKLVGWDIANYAPNSHIALYGIG